jgi:signal transduction histidine kinase
LETSRIEAGQITLNAQPLSLSEAIYLIADAIRPLLARKQQNLTIDLPPDLPLVSADRDRLSQMRIDLFLQLAGPAPIKRIHLKKATPAR